MVSHRHSVVVMSADRGVVGRFRLVVGERLNQAVSEQGHHILRIIRKGGEGAIVPLAPRTVRAVQLHVGERTSGPIFLGAGGQRMDHYAADRAVKRIARRAGIPKKISPAACVTVSSPPPLTQASRTDHPPLKVGTPPSDLRDIEWAGTEVAGRSGGRACTGLRQVTLDPCQKELRYGERGIPRPPLFATEPAIVLHTDGCNDLRPTPQEDDRRVCGRHQRQLIVV